MNAGLLLVNPPSPFLLDEKVFPPLGIMKVSADMDAPLLDLAGEKDYLEILVDALGDYDFVGIGSTTPQLPFAAAIARRVREVSPALTILGGSHATVASGGPRPDKSLAGLFDYVVANDGAQGLRALAGAPINGTAYPEGNDWGRDRLDIESYRYEIDGHKATSLISQFGCLAAGTKILLASGEEMPIEKMRVGDEVQCLDESSGAIITSSVAQAWSREADDLWEMKCDDGTAIKITSEHPIWTHQGWRQVSEIQVGEEIGFLREVWDGNFDILFRRIVSKRFIGRSRVYNLTVCPGHSYIANGIIVHNCPFACGFCCGRSIPFYRHVKYRQHEDVIAEIRHLYLRYGFTGFMFYDDEMNVNPKMIQFMGMLEDLQAELGVEFRFRGFVKAGIFTQAHATAMYGAGFRWLLCGFEGADPKLLLNINKKATVEDNTEMVEFAKKAGMKVKALMSIGHPGESPASVRAVEDWLIDVEPEDFDLTVITPYPGSPYYDKAQKVGDVWRYETNGDALYMDEVDYTVESDFYKGMQGAYISHVYTDHLSRAEIVWARDAVESSVRAKLDIPYPGLNQFDHSMGQS